MYNILKKYKSSFFLLVKLVIVAAAYYFISDKIRNSYLVDKTNFLADLSGNILENTPFLVFIVLFTFFNWFLEILKWKTLVSSIKKISFYQALMQSLSSLTISLLTPNRIGEYGAKAIYYPKNERSNILFLNFLGNFNQMLVTLLFGVFGLFFLLQLLPISLELSEAQIIGLFTFFILLLLFSLNKTGGHYLNKIVKQLKTIGTKIHFLNFNYSVLRYLIFSHQFYFLLYFFGADIDYFNAMQVIFTMYLFASVIPGFVVFDWLIKGSVAVSLFDVYDINEVLILSVTSMMWLANFALPSLIGSYFVLTFSKPENFELEENIISS